MAHQCVSVAPCPKVARPRVYVILTCHACGACGLESPQRDDEVTEEITAQAKNDHEKEVLDEAGRICFDSYADNRPNVDGQGIGGFSDPLCDEEMNKQHTMGCSADDRGVGFIVQDNPKGGPGDAVEARAPGKEPSENALHKPKFHANGLQRPKEAGGGSGKNQEEMKKQRAMVNKRQKNNANKDAMLKKSERDHHGPNSKPIPVRGQDYTALVEGNSVCTNLGEPFPCTAKDWISGVPSMPLRTWANPARALPKIPAGIFMETPGLTKTRKRGPNSAQSLTKTKKI